MSRLTRWAGTNSRVKQFGDQKLDTIITGHLTQEQVDAYQAFFRIEEISESLRNVDARHSILERLPSQKLPNFKRSPSPPPQYDLAGNRTNTREQRVLAQLEKERHTLVEYEIQAVKNYDPPVDYRKPAKTTEKLFIPAKDHPEINFVGLLLGPRGNTLRQLQENSGAKLAIRGKGSVKDGKLREPHMNEELHVLITADTTPKIELAIKLTNEVIEKAISSPEGQNDLKRDQLRELAILNGTLRESKPFVPPEMFLQTQRPTRDVTTIVCRICGGVGHYSRDCKHRGDSVTPEYSAPQRDLGSSYVPAKRTADLDLPPWKRARDTQTLPPWHADGSTLSAPPPEGHERTDQIGNLARAPPMPPNGAYLAPPPGPAPARPPTAAAHYTAALASPPPPGIKPPPPLENKPPPPATAKPPPPSALKPPPPPAQKPPPPPS